MSNPQPQYIRENTNPVKVAFATGKTTSIGYLVGMSAGTLVNASDTTWNTNLATTQAAFAALFLGASQQTILNSSVSQIFGNSEANTIVVATGGVWEYNIASATNPATSTTYAVGDYVGPAQGVGNTILNDTVVGVSSEADAVGVVTDAGTSTSTRLKVRLLSALSKQSR